jgi:iron complex transport system substrate-binding protein
VIGCHARVVSLDPSRLDDVIEAIGTVGDATGTERRAEALMGDRRGRLEVVQHQVSEKKNPRVLVIEWAGSVVQRGPLGSRHDHRGRRSPGAGRTR